MTDVTSSAQSAPNANSDSALSAPQPALNCTSPSAIAPRVSWVYLLGLSLVALSMLLPWCLAPFGVVVKGTDIWTEWSWLGAFHSLLAYGAIFSWLTAPLAPVPAYLGSLLILWRIFCMFRARSLLPPSGYSGIARGSVRVAVGLGLLSWGLIFAVRVL
jgi:hypothetical protein